MYDKSNRELLGRIEGRMSAIINKCDSEGRGLNASEREIWDKLADDHTRIEGKISRAEGGGYSGNPRITLGLEEMQDTFRLTPGAFRERKKDPQARAFSAFLRRGMDGLDGEDKQIMMGRFTNAQSTTTGSQGGFVVPQGFSQMIEIAKKWYGGIDKGTVGYFRTETGNPWPWPTVADQNNEGRIIAQNSQVVETDVTFGQVIFNSYIFSSDLVLVPLALMQDSYFDIDALVAELLGTRLGRLFNNKMTVGAGISAGEPTGIVTASVAAGNVYTFPTGETTSIVYDDLVNMEHLVDPAYRDNPSSYWMLSDGMLKTIKRLVDGQNRPLWQPGLTASFGEGAQVQGDMIGTRPTILSHPFVVNANMSAPSANSYSILFGDLSLYKVRQIADGVTIMRLVERYADYLQVGFIGWERTDGNLINPANTGVVIGQQSAT
jgi:HK97 family phage major capsid protein